MAKVTLTKTEIARMVGAIESASGTPCSLKFGYAMAKNRRKLEGEVEALRETQREFEKRRIAVAEEHCERGADDKPVFSAKGFVIPVANRKAHGEAIEALQAELDAFMAEPVDLELHQVPWACAPTLTVGQIDGLLELFIGEPPAEVEK